MPRSNAQDLLPGLEDLITPSVLSRRVRVHTGGIRGTTALQVTHQNARVHSVQYPDIGVSKNSLKPQTHLQTSTTPQRRQQKVNKPSNKEESRKIGETSIEKEAKECGSSDYITTIPEEICQAILQHIVTKAKTVEIIPIALAQRNINKIPLTYTAIHALSLTSRQIRESYQLALKANSRSGAITRASLHVLNFDFSPIINVFSGEHVPSTVRFKVKLTFTTDLVTRSSGWNGYSRSYTDDSSPAKSLPSAKVTQDLQTWLDFLVRRRREIRGIRISAYQCIKMGSTNDELEEIIDAIGRMEEVMEIETPQIMDACYDFFDDNWVE